MNIKYPGNLKKDSFNKILSYGNRGMSLEEDLNDTNNYYLEKDIAIIYKKPTPIQVVNTNNNKITEAYFKAPSTTDYNGIYKGKYIDFEAKETNVKTNFPLNNIHLHQINHIRNIIKHKGICFLIVRFSRLNENYLLFGKDLINFIDNNKKKKSIPINYFISNGYLIKISLNPKLDYLKILENFGGIK